MLEVISQDYIRTARSKGVPEWKVFFHHGFQNALLPIVTLAGMRLRTLFAGAVLVESIFAWPGIGRLTLLAMQERDYPLILGITLWAALLVVASNLLTDLVYARIDPRIEYV
jgi:peptide/nickel transport system permease protein